MLLKTASLPKNILHIMHIIKDKGTEPEFSGEYGDNFLDTGTYLCRQCGLALFRSTSKFSSACGWPSFDEEIPGAINRQIEITCARCHAHLGHMFEGEHYTEKNVRHCINASSLDFVSDPNILDTEEAIFAGGCFWGVEYYLMKLIGVLKTEVGYSGGNKDNPTDNEVASGVTGHYEVVRVIYDPSKINYEEITKYFFEIHNPFRLDQNFERPSQYRSAIFYYTEEQKQIALALIKILEKKGDSIATEVFPVSTFWRANTFNQQYYTKRGKEAECHRYEKRFE